MDSGLSLKTRSEENQDLQFLASGNKLDDSKWPTLLEHILSRLEHIVYNAFPPPTIPLPVPPAPSTKEDYSPGNAEVPIEGEPAEKKTRIESESTPKEDPSTATRQSEPSQHSTVPEKVPDSSKSPVSIAPPPNALPAQLLTLLQNIQSALTTTFLHSPPYTAQRLAELLLQPTRHYRTLPSYLRALDRIISVASSLSDFPLPTLPRTAGSTTESISMVNGGHFPDAHSEREDKDFIGGAELTEIPWLRNAGSPTPTGGQGGPNASDLRIESTRVIDGPNGAGSVETVTVNANGTTRTVSISGAEDTSQHGITQGELLRQEQEAGVVTVPSSTPNGRVTRSTAAASAAASRAVGIPTSGAANREVESEVNTGEEEPMHARGPSVIGMEDMGPQAPGSGLDKGLDVEGDLGKRGLGEGLAKAVGRPEEEKETTEKGEEKKDGTGSVLADADGVAEEEMGMDKSALEKGADAVDSTIL